MTDAQTRHVLQERFPPLVTPVRLREREDAFATAKLRAAEAGAGTIFHVGRFDMIEFAVVLEPYQPLHVARRALFPAMNALAETLAADCPPERVISFAYPGGLLLDQGLVGGGRLAWPADTGEEDVPDWLVFGAMIRTGGFQELGFTLGPKATTLEESGYRDIDPDAFAARFCRHLMVELDDWVEEGFRELGQRYLARLDRADSAVTYGIDRNGDLMSLPKSGGAAQRSAYVAALEAADWFDPETGEPRA